MNGKGLVLVLWIVNAAWTASLFLAPATLEPGTVVGLHGAANLVDHADLWATLPPFQAVVYALGDLNCHQMATRSWSVGGNQMPVDARMTAGFVSGVVGIALAFLVPAAARLRDGAVQWLPQALLARLDSPRRRLVALAVLWMVAATPLVVDVALQAVGPYESTNVRRAWTGGLFGVVAGYLVAVLFDGLMMGPAPARATSTAPRGGRDQPEDA